MMLTSAAGAAATYARRVGVYVAPEPSEGLFDAAAVVQMFRTYGGEVQTQATDTSNPLAPNGLELADLPEGPFTTHIVSTVAEALAAATGGSKRRVVAVPGVTWTETLTLNGGSGSWTDIILDISGVTWTPPQTDLCISVLGNRDLRLLIQGDRATTLLNNGISIFQAGDNYPAHIWVRGITAVGQYTTNEGAGLSAADGCTVRGRNVVFESCDLKFTRGGIFIWPGSVNVFIGNNNIECPKFSTYENGVDENPIRANGADLVVAYRNRTATYYGDETASGTVKNGFRMHGSDESPGWDGGRSFVDEWHCEGSGPMSLYAGSYISQLQSTWQFFGYVRGWGRDVPEPGYDIRYLDNFVGSPYSGDVMNARLLIEDMVFYTDGRTPGSSIPDTQNAGNVPPGVIGTAVYAAATAIPAWAFQDSPADLLS